jgi:hypothetical protein
VHEHVRWFGCAFTERVEVEPSVDDRIAALVGRHGPLIPLAAVMKERRAVGARDGLLRHEPPDTAPADPRIRELTTSLPLRSFAVDAATIDRLVEVVRTERPSTIVEFGSGTSTVVLAALLAERYRDGPRLVSFEQDPAWAERSRSALSERGLDGMASVIVLPLGNSEGGPAGYLLTEEAATLMRRLAPRLVFVDGPTIGSGASRLGTVDLVAPYLRGDAPLLLDDALRDAELCVAAAWEQRDGVVLHGIRPTAEGLLEATLQASSQRRRGLVDYVRRTRRHDTAPRTPGMT